MNEILWSYGSWIGVNLNRHRGLFLPIFPNFPPQAGLQPRDAVTVLWEAVGEEGQTAALCKVIQQHREQIEGTTKGPVVQRSAESDMSKVMDSDEQKVSVCGTA